MVCKKCGKKIRKAHPFCPWCGEAVPVEQPAEKPGKPSAEGATEEEAPALIGLAQINEEAKAGEKKKLTKKQLWIRIGIIAGAVVAALAIVIVSVVAGLLGKVNRASELGSDLGINTALDDKTGVQNIALFGLDSRADTESGRSDAIIILSIDRDHNAIKMTSIARDSLVAIEGHGQSKITHAFAWGKASLAVKTINQNFGMNITDYAYVNFYEFVELIDHVGGVMIDVDAAELDIMNNYYAPELIGLGFDYEPATVGYQRLTGSQALAYSRNRYTGSDIERGNRQKEVLQALFDEVKGKSLTEYPALISKVLSMCHTNLTNSEMLSIATWAITSGPSFSQFSLPSAECNAKGGNWNDGHGWVYRYDMGLATAILHEYIYEEEVVPQTTSFRTPVSNTTSGTTTTTTTTTLPSGSTTTTTTTAPPVDPDVSDPQVSDPDVSDPDVSDPDVSDPDVSDPDVSDPDVSDPEVSDPDVSDPDVSDPDVSDPDVSEPADGPVTSEDEGDPPADGSDPQG